MELISLLKFRAPFSTTLLIASALTLGACQTSPTGREQLMAVPESSVDSMGIQAFTEMKQKQPIDNDAADKAYVKCIADAITEVSGLPGPWEVVVFQSPEINAFALPGSKIGVYSGILKVARTPDQLATVLGHEVGHVVSQHGRERMSEQLASQVVLTLGEVAFAKRSPLQQQAIGAALGLGAQYGVMLPFSRAQESEADLVGLNLMAKAGFDPNQAIELWHNMSASGGAQPPAFLSDHPSNSARIGALQAHLAEAIQVQKASGKKPDCHR